MQTAKIMAETLKILNNLSWQGLGQVIADSHENQLGRLAARELFLRFHHTPDSAQIRSWIAQSPSPAVLAQDNLTKDYLLSFFEPPPYSRPEAEVIMGCFSEDGQSSWVAAEQIVLSKNLLTGTEQKQMGVKGEKAYGKLKATRPPDHSHQAALIKMVAEMKNKSATPWLTEIIRQGASSTEIQYAVRYVGRYSPNEAIAALLAHLRKTPKYDRYRFLYTAQLIPLLDRVRNQKDAIFIADLLDSQTHNDYQRQDLPTAMVYNAVIRHGGLVGTLCEKLPPGNLSRRRLERLCLGN